METGQELQQTQTHIVKAPEVSFENQVNRLVIRWNDASNEYILSHFKFVRSVDATYVHYVAFLF